MATCTVPLQEALNGSISSGRFTDTKIILFSRRDSSGNIFKPKALYANSLVLKSVPYFSDCGFFFSLSRCKKWLIPFKVLSGEYAESEQKDFSELIDEDEQAKNYDYYCDSDLEDDVDAVSAGKKPKKANPPKSNSPDPLLLPANDKKSTLVRGEWNESSGKGTVIKIHDIAYITYVFFFKHLPPHY